MIQACLNGNRRRDEHPRLPVRPDELARDALEASAAGALTIHVHPRDAYGGETLEPRDCASVVSAIRSAGAHLPLGFTTGEWIEPDLDRRLLLVRSWTVLPDFVSVNFSERGAAEMCRLALGLGMGIEAGLGSVEDAHRLLASGLADRCLRLLVEVDDHDPGDAVARAAQVDATLVEGAVATTVVHHGVGPATWAVLRAAGELGRDGRVGLEDVLVLPDGSPTPGNAELVQAAVGLTSPEGPGPRQE